MHVNFKSAAAAMFVAACTVAGIAVAAASTPAARHPSHVSHATHRDPGTSRNAGHGALQALVRGGGLNGTDESASPSGVPSDDPSETESPEPSASDTPEPGDDGTRGGDHTQRDENEQGEDST